jgi:hypothetical protein
LKILEEWKVSQLGREGTREIVFIEPQAEEVDVRSKVPSWNCSGEPISAKT